MLGLVGLCIDGNIDFLLSLSACLDHVLTATASFMSIASSVTTDAAWKLLLHRSLHLPRNTFLPGLNICYNVANYLLSNLATSVYPHIFSGVWKLLGLVALAWSLPWNVNQSVCWDCCPLEAPRGWSKSSHLVPGRRSQDPILQWALWGIEVNGRGVLLTPRK